MFVVDAGEGAARNIAQMGLPNGEIRALFLTHYHSDHIDGLGPMMLLRWTGSGNKSPFPVYGPTGVEAVAGGFHAASAAATGYRPPHHTRKSVECGTRLSGRVDIGGRRTHQNKHNAQR